jgi:uncharacterized protein
MATDAPYRPDPEVDHLDLLLRRFEPDFLGHRMRLQVDMLVRVFGHGLGGFHFENLDFLFPALDVALRATCLRRRAVDNVLRHRVTENVFSLPSLPAGLDGLRILHLSDLHIDCQQLGLHDLGAAFARVVDGLSFDLCLITGDFRYMVHGGYEEVGAQMRTLMPALECELGIYGILGNHDFIEQVPYLEQLGLKMLVNEAAAIERDGQQLWLVGVDDPHFYGTHDLGRAMEELPPGACTVGLIHSPELCDVAEQSGVDLYLTGHTHGGQLCLPGGVPIYRNARSPARMVNGRWSLGRMQGYTSAGTGSSGWPVRLNCPPEVAVHVLRRG